MCETKIKNIFREKLEINDDIITERAHRAKGKTTRNNAARKNQPRTIVIKLANYKDKSMILRNVKLKGSNIFINEGFSKQTTDLRKELWREVKQLRSEGKIAYLNYRTVVTKRRDNEG